MAPIWGRVTWDSSYHGKEILRKVVDDVRAGRSPGFLPPNGAE